MDSAGRRRVATAAAARELEGLRSELARFFPAGLGLGGIAWINWVDGVRIGFENGEVAHVRPSGNADELRVYTVADTPERAEALAAWGVAEPDGWLRRLERGA